MKIETITINTFLPMRDKFVYFCTLKIHVLGFNKLLERLLLVGVFPAKSCTDAWRSGSQLARGQTNMVDEAKLCRLVPSTFEALVVWCVAGIVGKKWAHFVDQCWLQVLPFSELLLSPAIELVIVGSRIQLTFCSTSQSDHCCTE